VEDQVGNAECQPRPTSQSHQLSIVCPECGTDAEHQEGEVEPTYVTGQVFVLRPQHWQSVQFEPRKRLEPAARIQFCPNSHVCRRHRQQDQRDLPISNAHSVKTKSADQFVTIGPLSLTFTNHLN
jgi:hypothetical protein